MSEFIKEGWVNIQRIPCKEGFIDRWMGDCANNPNNEKKSNYNLNSSAMFFRLNGQGKWFNSRDFKESVLQMVLNFCDTETAEDIWNSLERYPIENNN